MSDPTYPEYDQPDDEAASESVWEPESETAVGEPVAPGGVEAPEGIQPYALAADDPETDWWAPVLGCSVGGEAAAVEEPTVTWVDPSGTPQFLPGVDTNGDGVPDTVLIDTNGDGVNDAWVIDTDASGTVDAMFLDADGDGFADAVALDTGENGQWTPPAPIQAAETAEPAPDSGASPGTISVGGYPIDVGSPPATDPANTISVGGYPIDVGSPPATDPGTITIGGYPADFPASVNAYEVIEQLVNARQIALAQGDAFSVAQIDALIAHWVNNPAAAEWVRP